MARLRFRGSFCPAICAVVALSPLFLSIAQAQSPAPTPSPQFVIFPSGDLQLGGFIWKPPGDGRFPAILWNHGSEKLPGWLPTVAPVFLSRGYVFFIPHRRGQGRSPGPYISDQILQAPPAQRSALLVKIHEIQFGDQMAALEYLKARPFVDTGQLAVMGCSYGGIQTMLGAERGGGYKAAVDFAGAAQVWRGYPDVQRRLIAAAHNAAVPVFFIQAENDYDLTPSRVLSDTMRRAGKPFLVKIYPPFGTTTEEAHEFCVRGVDTWAADVFAFLSGYLR